MQERTQGKEPHFQHKNIYIYGIMRSTIINMWQRAQDPPSGQANHSRINRRLVRTLEISTPDKSADGFVTRFSFGTIFKNRRLVLLFFCAHLLCVLFESVNINKRNVRQHIYIYLNTRFVCRYLLSKPSDPLKTFV